MGRPPHSSFKSYTKSLILLLFSLMTAAPLFFVSLSSSWVIVYTTVCSLHTTVLSENALLLCPEENLLIEGNRLALYFAPSQPRASWASLHSREILYQNGVV
jgi:hypothetical protein